MHNGVGDAGLAELKIGAVAHRPGRCNRAVQVDDRGVVEAHPVAPLVDALPGHKARGGLHPLHIARKAVVVPVAADAPRAVAAHLAETAVRVIKAHPVVAALFRRDKDHQPVRADAGVKGAEPPRKRREKRRRDWTLERIQDHKVVPGPVHFCDVQGALTLFSG